MFKSTSYPSNGTQINVTLTHFAKFLEIKRHLHFNMEDKGITTQPIASTKHSETLKFSIIKLNYKDKLLVEDRYK